MILFASQHEVSFIISLQEYELVECTIIDDASFVTATQLKELEKFIRLYYELDKFKRHRCYYTSLKKTGSMHNEMTILKTGSGYMKQRMI